MSAREQSAEPAGQAGHSPGSYFPSFLAFYIKIKSLLYQNENQPPKLDLRYTTIFSHLRFPSKSTVTCILHQNENLPSKLDLRYTTILCHLRFTPKSKVTCILHRSSNQRKPDLRYTTMGEEELASHLSSQSPASSQGGSPIKEPSGYCKADVAISVCAVWSNPKPGRVSFKNQAGLYKPGRVTFRAGPGRAGFHTQRSSIIPFSNVLYLLSVLYLF